MWSVAAHVLGVSFLAAVLVSPVQAASGSPAKGPGQSGGVRRLPWRGRQWRRRSGLAAALQSGRRLHRQAIGRLQIRCAQGPDHGRHGGAALSAQDMEDIGAHYARASNPRPARRQKRRKPPEAARNSTAAATPRPACHGVHGCHGPSGGEPAALPADLGPEHGLYREADARFQIRRARANDG